MDGGGQLVGVTSPAAPARADVLVVDGANVVGSRPDGWWHDRPGAAARLHARLLDARALAPRVVLVLEGRARAGVPEAVTHAVEVVHAVSDGDSTIVDEVRRVVAAGRTAAVVTADRGLAARVESLGATLLRPGWLLDRIESPSPRSGDDDGDDDGSVDARCHFPQSPTPPPDRLSRTGTPTPGPRSSTSGQQERSYAGGDTARTSQRWPAPRLMQSGSFAPDSYFGVGTCSVEPSAAGASQRSAAGPVNPTLTLSGWTALDRPMEPCTATPPAVATELVEARPWVVASVTASADGRIALNRSSLLLDAVAGSLWRALHPAGAEQLLQNRRDEIERTYHPEVILEGSGSFVTESGDPPSALPPAEVDASALLESYLPQATQRRRFVVVDSRGRVRWTHKGDPSTGLLVLACETTPPAYLAYLRREQIPYLVAGVDAVDLALALRLMKSLLGVTCVLSEAGGGLNGALLRAGLVDELHVVLLPTLIGGRETPAVFDGPPLALDDVPTPLRLLDVKTSQDGVIWLHYDIDHGRQPARSSFPPPR